jgi:hypothetical protein
MLQMDVPHIFKKISMISIRRWYHIVKQKNTIFFWIIIVEKSVHFEECNSKNQSSLIEIIHTMVKKSLGEGYNIMGCINLPLT